MSYYSVILFQPDINEKTIIELVDYIKQGIKVYFFSFDPIDLIDENDVLVKAKEDQLLFSHEVYFTSELSEHGFSYFDGNIPQQILFTLTKESPFFNKDQFLIEHAPVNENIMVSAGAGTGKTTVMINRLLFLKTVQPDMNLADIGMVTFTNKAANNMRDKLIKKLKSYFHMTKDFKYLKWLQEVRNMQIGTIHSFAYNLLGYYQEEIFKQSSLVITQFKHRRKKIIEEAIDDFHEQNPELFRKFKFIEQYKIIQTVETLINHTSNLAIPSEKVDLLDFGYSDDDSHLLYSFLVKETIKRLEAYKKKEEFLDISDLIIKLDNIIALKSNNELPYKYLFIDEFQDTDRMQTKFFAYLANQHPVNLFVVGDVKQSVYRFRGADYTAFKQLEEQMIIHQSYHLQHNYRSDKVLITQLNEIFSIWPHYVPSFQFNEKDKLLPGFPPKEAEDFPLIKTEFSPSFLREIENSDTAILVRSNREVNELSAICDRNKIHYTAEQDGDFYRSLAVREFYLLVRRFTHPLVSRNRYVLHMSSYGERSIESNEIFENFTSEKNFIQPMLENVDTIFSKYEEEFTKRPVFEVFDELIRVLKPAVSFAKRFQEDRRRLHKDARGIAEIKMERLIKEYQLNLDQLLYFLKQELKDTTPTLHRLEKNLHLKMMTDRSKSKIYLDDEREKRLSIMTVHKAKGLEFDYVFLPNTKTPFDKFTKMDVIINHDRIGYKSFIEKGKTFRNDIYSQIKDDEKTENIGEESRLLYVALTRAKKGIYIDAPEQSNSQIVRSWGDLYAKGSQEKVDTTVRS